MKTRMQDHSKAETDKLFRLNGKLKTAITNRDKATILALYEEAKAIDMDNVKTSVFVAYDSLVEAGNEIVYS